jgi:hypothetical protein
LLTGGDSPNQATSGLNNNFKNDEDEVYIKKVLENFREQASSKKFVNLKDVYQILEKVEDKMAGQGKPGATRQSAYRTNPLNHPLKVETAAAHEQGRDFR